MAEKNARKRHNNFEPAYVPPPHLSTTTMLHFKHHILKPIDQWYRAQRGTELVLDNPARESQFAFVGAPSNVGNYLKPDRHVIVAIDTNDDREEFRPLYITYGSDRIRLTALGKCVKTDEVLTWDEMITFESLRVLRIPWIVNAVGDHKNKWLCPRAIHQLEQEWENGGLRGQSG